MIARILVCDNCGVRAPSHGRTGGQARKAENAGTIRRVILLRYRFGGARSRVHVAAEDLCAGCRRSAPRIADLRTAALLKAYGTDSSIEIARVVPNA